MSPKPVFLDVDKSLVENNLRITSDPMEEEFNTLFPSGEQYPSKLVKPVPGFCIKSKEIGTGSKIFVNICQTDAIPPPKDISEEELVEICNSDEPSEFRVPMSIGEMRSECDKKGTEAKAVDVAINPKFLYKVENSTLFKNFFMAVVFEGLQNKHKLVTNDDRIILRNRKAYGSLQMHRIQQREVELKMGESSKEDSSILDELRGNSEGAPKSKPKIETLSSVSYDLDAGKKVPEYRLFKKINEGSTLFGEVKLPNVIDSRELLLDVGEDRIILESKERGYFLDIFVPIDVIQDGVTSTFNKSSKASIFRKALWAVYNFCYLMSWTNKT